MTERVVVVGGGTAGTVLVNNLAEEFRPEIDRGDVEVVLVNDSPEHVYKPTWLYVPFGEKTPADAKRPLDELVDRRVALRIDRVTGVDTDSKRVTFESDRDPLGYDHLVLAMGAQVTPEETPGLAEGGHHFYGPEATEELRQELAEFTEGHLVMSVVGVPHMCPVAPLEFPLIADSWFRDRGLREDVDITYTYPINRAHGIRSVAEWAGPLMADRDIDVETFFNPTRVDPDEQVVHTVEGRELDYDLLVTIPPHDGSDVVREAGLGDDGWVDVDPTTLEAANAEDVYALGDVADLPTSKAGSAAHYAATSLADRLASVVRGQRPTAEYDGKTVCFIESGEDEATYIAFDYDEEPVPKVPSKLVHWSKLGYNQSYWLTARGVL
ncbi:NAD(P)/FAD-dependent oxidoreductase [Salinirubellus salinus]|uniref:NAD(P)/FAD-dependent oxidoreductase n=1 Tax=Salinirubellus salinus TaxID=1364945 RepID=A0A9E7R1Q0_9EURY|nr:FAD/NAD(P)-binding oxidoreductase [Salinirubellus salinus]UWM53981.1 NAD(P)/FAD-dependent oxidoreductase [Salinirubellus salinus]